MTRRVRIPASKYQESLATWRRYRNAVESLGLDVRFPFVREDDCRFRQVESILAEFGGVVPHAPLPSGWEGSRPTCYDGTLYGLLEYLRWATFAQSGDDGYRKFVEAVGGLARAEVVFAEMKRRADHA